MPRKEKFDEEAPPTQPEDWVGAAKTFHLDRQKRTLPSAMKFYIFQASNDSIMFAITDEDGTRKLPPCSANGEWRLFKTIEETGQPRVGFSEADAKAGIEEKGYYLTRVEIVAKEFVA